MPYRYAEVCVAVGALLGVGIGAAAAFDETKYPAWQGQWSRVPVAGLTGNPSFDPHRSDGRAQRAPLIAEYQSRLDASLADQAAGGAGLDRDLICVTPGMPRMMNVYSTMEIVVLPDTTYMLMATFNDMRRIFTDGRDWPTEIEPSYAGYSIGKWVDVDGDGRNDLLEVETREFKGPRSLDSTSIPLHDDNRTVIKERIYSDAADPDMLHDEITLLDNALARPWTVRKDYRRARLARPLWRESGCESNTHVLIGNEHYMLSADGFLMPAKKDQAPPDLRYFKRPAKQP